MQASHVLKKLLLIAATAILLSACASQGGTHSEPHPDDPWEGFNRGVWAFNRGLDKAIVKPIAQGYHYITPNFIEEGITNFVDNLAYTVTVANLLLQGRFRDFGTALGRLVLNSTFGLGGLVDVASVEGIARHDEDFGQTFAVWGWKESPYLMLPFLGPSTLRDGIGRVPEIWTDGGDIVTRKTDRYEPLIGTILSARVNLLPRDEEIDAAPDSYLFVRDAWLQNRRFKISNGNNELPDYEFFLDEGEPAAAEQPDAE